MCLMTCERCGKTFKTEHTTVGEIGMEYGVCEECYNDIYEERE